MILVSKTAQKISPIKLKQPVMLVYDRNEVYWETPDNLHDKILLWVFRKRFAEALAKRMSRYKEKP